MIYDLLFFFMVIIIVLNLIFGVIIDTFADLRSEKQKKEEILKTTCFICGECGSPALAGKLEPQGPAATWPAGSPCQALPPPQTSPLGTGRASPLPPSHWEVLGTLTDPLWHLPAPCVLRDEGSGAEM